MDSKGSRATPTRTFVALPVIAALAVLLAGSNIVLPGSKQAAAAPPNAKFILAKCASLDYKPGPLPNFVQRTVSDRFEEGTPSVWIQNATLWTGDGIIRNGDLLLDNGIIKHVGESLASATIQALGIDELGLHSLNARGAFVTPALIDVHYHAGVLGLPDLQGTDDANSMNGLVQPWLRSLDGFNTHDLGPDYFVAGGVGTTLVMPGSANAIGGQAFAFKLRPTAEKSPASMLVEPPFTYNGSGVFSARPWAWRYLKQAAGENPSRNYGVTRMDSIYAMRSIYTEARKLKEKQDAFCASARAQDWLSIDGTVFPEDLRYEALVDVLRGRVKVQTHCYEAVDLDNTVRLSNEFKFPIAAFHHAHETYLVPDVLKKAYGGPPVSAIFAALGRYKQEAYRHSEFAGRILHDAGLEMVMHIDHPSGINSLLYEAQQIHYHGLPAETALRGITTTPAKVLGLDHRLGYLRRGYDADIVLWDSHPMQLAATPMQVFIDGIPQFKEPVITHKSPAQQAPPVTPDWTNETASAIACEGLQPLWPRRVRDTVRFVNVSTLWKTEGETASLFGGEVIVQSGRIICEGECAPGHAKTVEEVIDLGGGEIGPALTSFGKLSLSEIEFEPSTGDGFVSDTLPSLMGPGAVVRASDGVSFGLRNNLLAYRNGVTSAVVFPVAAGPIEGIGSHVSFGATHKLDDGAVPKPVAILKLSMARGQKLGVSTQIALLRNLLTGGASGELGLVAAQVLKGEIPIVIHVDSADIIASLIELKAEVDKESKIRLVISGATEAHLVAKELAAAKVGVIVNSRPLPLVWDMLRVARRPPLARGNAVTTLKAHNVTVAVARTDGFVGINPRQLRWDLGWVLSEADGALSYREVVELGSTNLEKMLGLELDNNLRDLVAYAGGGMLSFESKPVAAIVPSKARVDIF
ncbi:hypothetical protein BKA62DRAFT_252537 [Auriculariales sp. MPI-PUGE-AT-0066]|nr:hypothetical protein BKA62DRAFT_252537 [Auriculariales sp. MPI-PUGE-AT-0066]